MPDDFEKDVNEFEINEIVKKVVDKYGSNIDNMTCMSGLIDSLFHDAEDMFKKKALIFTFGYIFPYFLHFFLPEMFWLRMSFMTIAFLTLCFISINEYVQLKYYGWKEYLDFNIVPFHFTVILLLILDRILSEENESHGLNTQFEVMLVMFRITLIVIAFLKFMYYIKVYKQMGQLV